jgi:light-regulated signal transduction histidine kinase (bacteriophytochrome)
MYQRRASKLSVEQALSLQQAISQIRQSLELKDILETTVVKVQLCLGVDRVMLYQFHADASGEVVAETIRDRCLPPLLGLNFPADDIPRWARELYLKAHQRTIVNVQRQQIGFSPLFCPDSGDPLEAEDIQFRPIDPCHINYLTAMGVQASLVVPILHYSRQQQGVEPQLWGLLIAHHAQPHAFDLAALRLVQQVADQAALAIAQATLLAQAQQQARREAALNKITGLLHTLPEIQLYAALEETVQLLQGSGGRLYLKTAHHDLAQIYTVGQQPRLPAGELLEQQPLWQATFDPLADGERYWAMSDLGQQRPLAPLAAAFTSQQLRGLLVLPLGAPQGQLGYLSIFRREIVSETWWAGEFNPAQQQQRPRQSFAAWRELRQGQVRSWQPCDLEAAAALQQQFSLALQHHSLYEQVQTLNSSLERQVQQRTAELQQSLESAHVLRQITNQIRSTLDYPVVLQTIVHQVRSLLNTDRVLIYKFDRNYQGHVIVEAVLEGWRPLLHEVYDDICFPLEYVRQYRDQGRIGMVANVAQSDLDACHISFLNSIQVKANLAVPIRIGPKLWGLLIAHACQAPRPWQTSEVALVQQLADQAAIAIQQARLYEQTRTTAESAMRQAVRLQQTLQELKQTQAQLIQTEKMSSLGQLVAGVAHEINNPINFIQGNLPHAQAYITDLLTLVQYYQQGRPYSEAAVQQLVAAIDLDFIVEDLPKVLASMKLGTERIHQIVLILRNFSRLDETAMKPVDIHEGLDSTLLLLQHRLQAQPGQSEIKLVKQYGKIPPVECYSSQLNQVFMNVISNAIDAIAAEPGAGEITLITQQIDSNWIEIAVQDTGPGVPAAIQAKLFDPFFTTKPVGEGTGLGLALSYQIIEKHGGKLLCRSAAGQGTTFKIQIPIRQRAQAAG